MYISFSRAWCSCLFFIIPVISRLSFFSSSDWFSGRHLVNFFFFKFLLNALAHSDIRKYSPPPIMEYTIHHDWLFFSQPLFLFSWLMPLSLTFGISLSTGFSCCVCVCVPFFLFYNYLYLVTIVFCSDTCWLCWVQLLFTFSIRSVSTDFSCTSVPVLWTEFEYKWWLCSDWLTNHRTTLVSHSSASSLERQIFCLFSPSTYHSLT